MVDVRDTVQPFYTEGLRARERAEAARKATATRVYNLRARRTNDSNY